jgi:hypothetical protein
MYWHAVDGHDARMQVMGMKLGRFCHELDKLPKAPVFELEDI